MRTEIFLNAWKIKKVTGLSFSKSLKLAWKSFKNDVKVVVTESWNKIKRIAFSKNGLQSDSIEKVISFVSVPVNNNGASKWYDGKTFNND